MPEAPRRKPPASPDRRKLLVAGAYAAVNAAVIGGLGRRGGSGSTPPADAGGKGPDTPGTVAGAPTIPPDDHVYDVVIKGGRVIDPDSGYDRVADVGIDGGTISSISEGSLRGTTMLSAGGRIVAPGFIDLLSYEPADEGAAFKIQDGVTTNLGMHGINGYADDFFEKYTDNCLVNFGGAFEHPWMRSYVEGLELDADEEPSANQIAQLADLLRQELPKGWIGVDFEPEYYPGTTFEEMVALARVAKEFEVPCFFHGRHSAVGTNAETLDEIIEIAKETGAAVHIEHIISTGGTFDMAASLARVEKARAEGHDVSACMYPYNYWAAYLNSTRFADGWQERFRISYSDLQVAGTAERLTEGTFEALRGDIEDNKLAAAFAIPEADVDACIQAPWVMIGSDAILTDGNNHPRSTGCFARTLGLYAREKGLVSWTEALAKMTVLPARRLEAKVPALRKKGRLQRGADADITIFDPERVIDRSTVAEPAVASAGIEYVLIAGHVVKSPDGIDMTKKLGQPITGEF